MRLSSKNPESLYKKMGLAGRKNIGILAFQGGIIEHTEIIENLGYNALQVKTLKDFDLCDALIIPGGESTTIGFFLEESGLRKTIKKSALQGMPIWGTCAGAILLAKKIESKIVPPHLELMDISIQRNAYGRQIDSFYSDLEFSGAGIQNLRAAFIRAPIIKKSGASINVLATYKGNPVLVQQKNLLASTFHPELRNDPRLHRYFCSLIGVFSGKIST